MNSKRKRGAFLAYASGFYRGHCTPLRKTNEYYFFNIAVKVGVIASAQIW